MPTTPTPTRPSPTRSSARLIDPQDRAALNEAWGRHRQHILNALDHADGAFSEEHVLLAVAQGTMQLWSGEKSVLVTEYRTYPGFKSVIMIAAGGDLGELRDMERLVTGAAKHLGCTKAAIVDGRKGWLRALPGYRLASVNLVKDI